MLALDRVRFECKHLVLNEELPLTGRGRARSNLID